MGMAADTLAWLDSPQIDDQIVSHPGAAYEEREILRLILSGASGTGGVLSAAYRAKLAFHVADLSQRAEARSYAHLVMFASDFGLDPVQHPSAMNDMLDAAVFTHANDTDTLGELLIAAHLLGHSSAAIDAADGRFHHDWLALQRTFENYHAILVGGILYALSGA